jgi:electron transfer flavoprotein alpha/beta subunit
MTVVCGFCQRRGHNIVSCPRLKKVMDRIEKQIQEQVLADYKFDVVRQLRTTVEKMQADMEFLRKENDNLAQDNKRLWEWLEKEGVTA